MKLIAILIVLGGIGIFLMFQFGGYASLDPAEQAETFREQVDRGMTWEQVAEVREPREIVPLRPGTRSGEGMPRDFDREQLTQMIQDDELVSGFMFKYRFDASHHYDVVFDGDGEVRGVNEPATAKDLYEGELFTP